MDFSFNHEQNNHPYFQGNRASVNLSTLGIDKHLSIRCYTERFGPLLEKLGIAIRNESDGKITYLNKTSLSKQLASSIEEPTIPKSTIQAIITSVIKISNLSRKSDLEILKDTINLYKKPLFNKSTIPSTAPLTPIKTEDLVKTDSQRKKIIKFIKPIESKENTLSEGSLDDFKYLNNENNPFSEDSRDKFLGELRKTQKAFSPSGSTDSLSQTSSESSNSDSEVNEANKADFSQPINAIIELLPLLKGQKDYSHALEISAVVEKLPLQSKASIIAKAAQEITPDMNTASRIKIVEKYAASDLEHKE